MVAISSLIIIIVTSLKLNGALTGISGVVTDSFPSTVEKKISAQRFNLS